MLSFPDFKQKQIIFADFTNKRKLSLKNDNIIIKDENDKIILQQSCYRTFAIFIIGNTNITTPLLQKAKRFKFSISLLSYSFKPYFCFNSPLEGNVLLRKKQYNYDKLDIAKHIVKNKISNQILTLKKTRNKDTKTITAIDNLIKYTNKIDNLCTRQEILGIEGLSARIYFQSIFASINWKRRLPRAKIDKINTLLDIGYTKLFYLIEAFVNLYGFDIYKGIYHQEFYQRKSLICDLVEPFRVLIDYKILKAFNLGQIKDDDFIILQNKTLLNPQKAKIYSGLLLQELIENKNDIFMYIQQYYRAFMKNKDIEHYPIFERK